jgi:hypothetical protein
MRRASGLGGARATVKPDNERAAARAQPPRRRRRLTPVGLVLAVGILAIVSSATGILLKAAPRRAGANLTTDTGFVVPLPGGQELCDPGEIVPAQTAALRVSAQAGLPAPELRVTVSSGGEPPKSGRLAVGWHTGTLDIPVSRVSRTIVATVCLANRGASDVRFGGSAPNAFTIQIAGKPFDGRPRVEYMRPGRESWLSLLPALSHRFSLGKSDLVRHWAAAASIVLMLIAVFVALRTVLAEGRSR